MSTLKKYDVFISYSHVDERVANQICRLFDEYRLSYFIDKESIKPASVWLDVLAESIKCSSVFLLLVSKHLFESEYSMMELQYAYSERNNSNISILPYLIEEGFTVEELPGSVKMILNSIQWLSVEKVPIGNPLIQNIKAVLHGHLIERVDLSALPRVLDVHCYRHVNRSVAGYCTDCGKFLCLECASKYSPCLCDECYNTRLINHKSKQRKQFYKRIITGFILALIASSVAWEPLGSNAFFIGALTFFFPFGTSIISYDSLFIFMFSLPAALIGGVIIFIRDLIRLLRNKFY